MKLTFVSNYLNHHQIPVANYLYDTLGDSYCFIQTEPMEEERKSMGWEITQEEYPYLLEYYQNPKTCQELIDSSDIVIFGGVEDEAYIQRRLMEHKLIIRASERLYKEGQWKAVSPRGLVKKYQDHIRYRKSPVYLLCAGAYVASDFHLIGAYPNKMFQWGYFPKFYPYDIDRLLNKKRENKKVKLLFSGRYIDWKHGEDALLCAAYLRDKGYNFQLTMIGDGPLKNELLLKAEELNLQDYVRFLPFMKPEEVRKHMEETNIYLFLSDYREGWGVVLNEAMNSGCAVVANIGIGAVPVLLQPKINGLMYKNHHRKQLFRQVETLLLQPELRDELGKRAYQTIEQQWNPKNCAEKLWKLCYNLFHGQLVFEAEGPLCKAKPISPWRMYRYLNRGNKQK
jgi:glycosyltransferase involved in cell wall biosynthesis